MRNTFKVLSIDAWGNSEDGYEWNNWFDVGTVTVDLDSPESVILESMLEDYINTTEPFSVDDDGYNLVIVRKESKMPVFAIEYGSTI
jgi:hypothetical protein